MLDYYFIYASVDQSLPWKPVKTRQYYRDYITKELKYTAVAIAENTYYHFIMHCVQRKHPSFQPSQLVIPRDLLINVVHVAHLMDEFGITL